MAKRPLFFIDFTDPDKTLEQMQAEAWEAIQKLKAARQADATDDEEEENE
jgi:hypothetical protein